MAEPTPREILAEADRRKRTAKAADMARTYIRLGYKPSLRKRLLFWRRGKADELVLDETTTWAIYEALAIVQENHERQARTAEARVTASGGGTS